MYTQCPACKTVFNVKPEQLRAARGKVRCSRCQTIFNAAEHRYTPESAPSTPAATETSASARPQTTPPEKPPTTRPQAKQAEKTAATKPAAKQPPREKPAPAAMPPHKEKPAASSEPHDDDWFDLTPAPAAKHTPPKKAPTTEPPAAKEPTSVEDELNDDLFKLFAKQETPESPAPDATPVTPDESGTERVTAGKPTPKEARAEVPDKDKKKGAPAEKAQAESQKAKGGNYSLPPQLESRPIHNTMRTLSFVLSNLMLIAALGAQYAYSHRIPLRENESLRPWLDTLCQITACPLPPRRDLDKIELVDNMMQSHPRYQDSLLITATLINRADYAQPYPIVEITMSDLQQKVVAKRTFRPEEYLAGDIAQMGFTPNVEVAMMLEVADPGNNAVGFKFDFY